MGAIQAFTYRVPRFTLRLPVSFCSAGAEIRGVSENLSETGLLVTFTEPLLPGSTGRMRLYVEQCWIEMQAEVAYAELFQAGLAFQFATETERRFLQALVKVVSRARS